MKGETSMNFREKVRQTGITMVALVITIIVLLILSGVVLNLTLRRKWSIKKNKYGQR